MIREDKFKDGVESVAQLIDIAGVAIIAVGLLVATVLFFTRAIKRGVDAEGYRGYRQQLGRAILLGLEFLVAADIIRTVAVAPTFRGVGVLAVIVAVRTFLSFTLEVELEGRWPWQKREARAA